MGRLIRLSIGGVSQFLVSTASWIALVRIIAFFGSSALAGYTIAVRIVVFAILPSWGMANAAATLVGQCLGAGKPDRAERAVWMTGLYNMVFLCVVAVVFAGFAPLLIRIFTDDPEVTGIAVSSLRIISLGYPAFAWGLVMVQAFNGAGDTWTPTRLNLACFWLFQIPVAWLLARTLGLGPNGVYWAVALSYSLAAVAAIVLFKRGRWKITEV
jgi:Na+-driven multidrug efflux pump